MTELLPDDLAAGVAERAAALGELAGVDEAGRAALGELAERLRDTYPYGDPRYAGQMLKPPHPVAWAAYATAMTLNPNNHALDGGPATAAMEREAVDALAAMLGVKTPLGHLTSSGTIANLEALWVARELGSGGAVLHGADAHYTHERMCALLGVPAEPVPRAFDGRMDVAALEARLARGGVDTVVATLGSTGLGLVDPVHEIADVCARHGVRLHVDAAYGGFHTLLAPDAVDAAPFEAVGRADSVVIDPHKHGLQPYGCGCVVFADPGVGRLYAHDSPYTYFTSRELHLGEISLECSRAGAAAAALWTTLQVCALTCDGLGAVLAAGRAAALRVAAAFEGTGVALVVPPDLDIVCPFPASGTASEISARCERAFDTLADDGWHVAKLRVDAVWLASRHPGVTADADTVTTLRCCLMKPSHLDVADELAAAIAAHLAAAA